MSQLKRYACQTAKTVVGASVIICIVIVAGILAKLLEYPEILRGLFCLIWTLIFLMISLFIGHEIFRKYDICQRFK
jgi:multisubunit Na+/H+ antiporter MnhB subunit